MCWMHEYLKLPYVPCVSAVVTTVALLSLSGHSFSVSSIISSVTLVQAILQATFQLMFQKQLKQTILFIDSN